MSKLKSIFQYSLKHYPLVTNISIYGSFYLIADLSQQKFNQLYKPEKPKVNYAASVRLASVGCMVYAPLLYYWYRYLDRMMPGNRTKYVMIKVALDQGFMTPLIIISFYIIHSVLERREDIFEELSCKFWRTFFYNQCFWIPAQTINFTYMSPQLRVIFVASVSFLWINLLCFIKREKVNK